MKNLKKISLVILVAILPALGFSQSMFDKYEDMDNVGSVIVNKGMINLLGSLAALDEGDKEAQEFMEMAQGINGIKVFMTEDDKVSADMGATVKKYLKSSRLEELMRVKDEDVNVKFYIRNGKQKDHVSELLMFVSELKNVKVGPRGRHFETVLVSMTGDIDLKKVGKLTDKMDLPKELKKAEKGR
ncbi:DUF4252 domain-containing protein [Maribacter sp. 2210JD10-5]|uniref:DUF4252 domain-containing protein n=1 Tax=Maribacter sp. 2210JD10-5 TaxID=3386272 RepID=UPI0039BC9165